MSDIQVIGISGKAGSGKDYICQRFFVPEYAQFSFAWHMKVWVIGKGLATHEEVFKTKPPAVRKLLQEEGTERGRNVYGEQVWVNTTFEWMRVLSEHCGIHKFVIPDVRFPNEANAILERGGQVYRVDSPNRSASSNLTPEARLHPSETALDQYDKFTGFILNDPQWAETVPQQIAHLRGERFSPTDDPEDDTIWGALKTFLSPW